MILVPELLGDVFIGRSKEGFSTSKLMVGYYGWTNERATINDALIPILADGVKWTGGIPSGKLVYNADLFESSTINRLRNHFIAILDQAVTDPDLPLLDIQLEKDRESGFTRASASLQEYGVHQFNL